MSAFACACARRVWLAPHPACHPTARTRRLGLAAELVDAPPHAPLTRIQCASNRYGTSSAIVGALNLGFEIKLYPDDNTSFTEAILLGFGWGQYHIVLEVSPGGARSPPFC